MLRVFTVSVALLNNITFANDPYCSPVQYGLLAGRKAGLYCKYRVIIFLDMLTRSTYTDNMSIKIDFIDIFWSP